MTTQKPSDRWYYAKDKKKLGPVTLAQLQRLLADGELKPADMVFQEGTQKWRPLAEVAGVKPEVKRAGVLGKRALVIGAVAAVGVVFVTLSCCGLVAILTRSSPSGDMQAVGPAAEKPNKAADEIGSSKVGEAQKPQDKAPNSEPELEFTSTKTELDVPARLVAQMGHYYWVKSVCLSSDNKWLITGGGNTAVLWEAATGKELRTFRGHDETVNSVFLSGDDRWLATGSWDQTARLWDVNTGNEVRIFRGHTASVNSASLSPDGKWLATGSDDKTARLWEVATGKINRVFRGHSDGITSLALSSDSKLLITGSRDKTARIWDLATGVELRILKGNFLGISCVALSHDGRWVFTGHLDGIARLWEVSSGEEIRSFVGHSGKVNCASASWDGKWLATGGLDKTARLWEVASGKEVRTFRGHSDEVNSASLSRDGKLLATVGSWGDKSARLWEVATGKGVRAFRGESTSVDYLSVSADGKWLITVRAADADIRMWEMGAGRQIRLFRRPLLDSTSITMSGDRKWLVTGHWDHTARLWDLTTGKEVRTFRGHSGWVKSVALSRDGKWLATGSWDNTACLWDRTTGKKIHTFRGHTGPITSVSLFDNGKWLLTGSQDETARLWDLATGKEIRTLRGQFGPITSAVLSSDGKWLATGSWHGARLWELATGNEVQKFRDWGVDSLALSGDDKWLITGSHYGRVRLWELATGREIREFHGHSFRVLAISLSGDGKRLSTGSLDGTTRMWEVATGKELCRLVSFQDGSWAVIDPTGRFDADKGGNVEGLHWVADNETMALSQLKERYYDPGLLAKHMGFNKEPLREVKAFKDVKLFPEVTVANAKELASTKLDLDLINRGGGIGKVQVFVNGMELVADARGPKFQPKKAKARLTVDLADAPSLRPGQKNKITVVTWNQEGYLSSRGLDLDWDAPGKKDERGIELYAIVGGISDYAGPNLRLRYAAKDAEDIAKALTLGAKRLFGAEKVHVTLLTTTSRPGALAPTRANFEKAFADVRQKARPDDVLLVYLAGHGVSLGIGTDQYCYLTQEARTADIATLSDPAVLAQTTITSSELTEWVKKIPALKQVLVLDTCAAGAAAAKLTEIRQVTGDQVRALERLKDRTGFHVLMGCAADKVSYEATPFEQGLLTHALLKGMRGAALNKGEYLDVSTLFQYAADEVPQLARGIGGVQKPLIAAPRGTSFDVARFTTEDKAAVPLKAVKPLVLRPVLLNPDKGFDDLDLMPELRKHLANAAVTSERGPGKNAVFVDAEDMPGAVRPSATYTVSGNKVTVRLRLIRDGVPLKMEPLLIEGVLSDRAALLDRLTEAIFREAWSGMK